MNYQTLIPRTLSRYYAKGKLDCFNCKTGVFSDYSLQCLQKKAITIHVLGEKSTPLKEAEK